MSIRYKRKARSVALSFVSSGAWCAPNKYLETVATCLYELVLFLFVLRGLEKECSRLCCDWHTVTGFNHGHPRPESHFHMCASTLGALRITSTWFITEDVAKWKAQIFLLYPTNSQKGTRNHKVFVHDNHAWSPAKSCSDSFIIFSLDLKNQPAAVSIMWCKPI